jgi:hypothetical protein
MRKTIEAAWREGFLNPDALVAPKVNNLYTRKSSHIVDRIQRMQRINETAIVIGAPIMWVLLSAVGIPYTGAIICTVWVGLLVVRRLYADRIPGAPFEIIKGLVSRTPEVTARVSRRCRPPFSTTSP